MREIDGTVFYSVGDVSAFIGSRSRQTIVQWDVFSDFLEQEQGIRLIPKPVRVNGQRLYTKEQVREIKRFAESKKNGVLSRLKREYKAKKKTETKPEKKQNWPVDGRSIR